MATELEAQLEGKRGEIAGPGEAITGEEEKIYVAGYWQLMWWRFKKHRMALISGVILILFYFVAIFAEFVAPYNPEEFFPQYKLSPPTKIHIRDAEGKFHFPFVYQMKVERDKETLRRIYVEDTSTRYPIKLFVHGTPYKLWGIIETDIHLFGIDAPLDEQRIFLFGADRLGRDLFSRLCYGARISLSIGLVGVFISLALGIVIGGISGYYGGRIDNLIQRVIEFVRSIPQIPLWMGLSAALPPDWPIVRIYFGITVILSLVHWTGMARVVRGRFLSLREEDFIMAARLAGSSEMRIILRHMVPSFLSYIIAALTLAIPNMILSETGLSFIGLGLRAPAISWGVLLQEAQNLRSVVLAPWVLSPALAVVTAVLAFNFLGDGLRDAADPYAR
ncbi:MAG TPA: ABC transporter permease [Caldilineae bacterium]|jgi:peptide/nickel transport system permease protein|nr:ABC transporter permease [Caldilineae bacterium]